MVVKMSMNALTYPAFVVPISFVLTMMALTPAWNVIVHVTAAMVMVPTCVNNVPTDMPLKKANVKVTVLVIYTFF